MTTTYTRIEITAKARAFTGYPIQKHRFAVEPDGTVRVFDDIARHFTNLHGLTQSATRRIRRLARRGNA